MPPSLGYGVANTTWLPRVTRQAFTNSLAGKLRDQFGTGQPVTNLVFTLGDTGNAALGSTASQGISIRFTLSSAAFDAPLTQAQRSAVALKVAYAFSYASSEWAVPLIEGQLSQAVQGGENASVGGWQYRSVNFSQAGGGTGGGTGGGSVGSHGIAPKNDATGVPLWVWGLGIAAIGGAVFYVRKSSRSGGSRSNPSSKRNKRRNR